MSIEQWESVRAEYEAGTPAAEIEARWGVTASALYYRARSGAWAGRRGRRSERPLDVPRWRAGIGYRLMRAADALARQLVNDIDPTRRCGGAPDNDNPQRSEDGREDQAERTGRASGKPEPSAVERHVSTLQSLVRSVQAIDKLHHGGIEKTARFVDADDDGDLVRMRAELERRLDRFEPGGAA